MVVLSMIVPDGKCYKLKGIDKFEIFPVRLIQILSTDFDNLTPCVNKLVSVGVAVLSS